jgi:histidinol-phosphate aminotransferase
MKIEELLRENIRKMQAYSSARDENDSGNLIQLDANENPFDSQWNRYPDPYQRELKKEIAAYKGLSEDNLVLGNGSDELIDLIIRAFCEPNRDNVIGIKPSYGMYKVCCDLNNVEYRQIELGADFSLDAQKLLRAVDENTKVIFLCSPNNPSANSLASSEIEELLMGFEGMLIIDEAYIDFSTNESWSKRLNNYPQLIVLQTVSKAFGMASVRLGMAWCSVEMLAIFNKIKPPYNINGLTQESVLKSFKNKKKIAKEIALIIEERKMLLLELSDLEITTKVYHSDANFILVRFKNALNVYEYLLENGVVVRDRSKEFNCENCLRISIGTANQNKITIKTLKQYSNEKSAIYR